MTDAEIRKRKAERKAQWRQPVPVSIVTGLPAEPADIEGVRELPPPSGPGIYFLYKGEAIVYVGQSRNPVVRVFAHHFRRDFDRVFLLECDESSLDWLESLYIHKLRPPGNRNGADGGMRAPMSELEVS